MSILGASAGAAKLSRSSRAGVTPEVPDRRHGFDSWASAFAVVPVEHQRRINIVTVAMEQMPWIINNQLARSPSNLSRL